MSAVMPKFNIGDSLKRIAKQLGKRDADVAREAQIGERTYGFYAEGRRNPPFDKLIRICRALKTTPNVLLGFDEYKLGSEVDPLILGKAIHHVLEQAKDVKEQESLLTFEQQCQSMALLYNKMIKKSQSEADIVTINNKN